MLNRPDDIPYCNVNKEKIENASPKFNEQVLGFHNNYIFERHRIYKAKEIYKLPREEWTNDEVFKKFRFTNVRRELDRESKWLIKNVCESDLSLENKILNCILFRTFNKSSTLEIIGAPITDFDNIEVHRQVFIRHAELNPKYVFFTSAFNTGGLKAANAFPNSEDLYECTSSGKEVKVTNGKIEKMMKLRQAKDFCEENNGYHIVGFEKNIPMRAMHLVRKVWKSKLASRIIEARSQLEVYNLLLEVKGFSDFLSYQIFVDFTYIPEFRFSENEFTVSGPGCSRGISYMFEDKDGMTDEECLFWLRDNLVDLWKKKGLESDLETLFDHLPEYDRCLNVMMLENSFCELSKYTKARLGTGRPRVKYTPTEDSMKVQLENECNLEEWE